MCKDKDNGEATGGVKRKMPVGRKFNAMNAKEAQEASVRARNIRKQIRAQMLDTLVNNMDFGVEMLKAIKKGDIDQVQLLETALKIVGLTHNQSEEAVQNIKVDANVDANVDATVKTVKFVLDKPCQKDSN